MRDYSNIPVLNWTDDKAPLKAKAQIEREEPVILQMPDTFNTYLNGEDFAGRLHTESGIQYDCDGSKVMCWLAIQNHEPDLHIDAEACASSSSLEDLDGVRNWLIVHD